jgi:hypothetical protein
MAELHRELQTALTIAVGAVKGNYDGIGQAVGGAKGTRKIAKPSK